MDRKRIENNREKKYYVVNINDNTQTTNKFKILKFPVMDYDHSRDQK